MLEELKKAVCEVNLELVRQGLVVHTFGNASGIDGSREHVVIKPSGVPYEQMGCDEMVVVSLKTGEVVESGLNASSDTPTHLALYRAFPSVGGIVHTHSLFATAWAQARKDIPCFGTTHADYFHGPVPCTRLLRPDDIKDDYEANTGRLIVERLEGADPLHFPGMLVADHGPFAWGVTPADALGAAFILEYLAKLATWTLAVAPEAMPLSDTQIDLHFFRKHGPDATYGQRPGGG